MRTSRTRISIYPKHWLAVSVLCLLALVLAACGGDSTPSSSTSSQTNSSSTSSSSASATTVTVTITEKTGGHDIYSFNPQTLTIKAGTIVKWVNNSDENHLLAGDMSSVFTASSLVSRSGSNDNTYQLTFSTPGTYTYTSTLVQRMNNQQEGMASSATGTITVTS
jgi:plastocyanin